MLKNLEGLIQMLLAQDLFRLCQMAQHIIANNPELMLGLLTRPRGSAKDVTETISQFSPYQKGWYVEQN